MKLESMFQESQKSKLQGIRGGECEEGVIEGDLLIWSVSRTWIPVIEGFLVC